MDILSLFSPGKGIFLTSFALLLGTAIFISSLFRQKSGLINFLSVYLISYSEIVLIGEIASLTKQLNSIPYFLMCQTVVLLGSIIVWLIFKRPVLFSIVPIKTMVGQMKGLITHLNHSPELWVLVIGGLVSLGLAVISIILVPQNIFDIVVTYFGRIGFWLNHASFEPWPALARYIRQITYPFNPQIVSLWLILFYGTDTLTGFHQWISVITIACTLFLLTEQIGASKKQALFSATLFVTIPIVVIQSSRALNDMVICGLFIAVIYFLIAAYHKQDKKLTILSALAFGLGVGTKQVIFFTLPGLFILLLLLWIKGAKVQRTILIKWAIESGLASVALGAYSYIQNFIYYGNFLGAAENVDSFTLFANIGGVSIKNTLASLAAFLYTNLDGALPFAMDHFVRTLLNKAFIFYPGSLDINFPFSTSAGVGIFTFGMLIFGIIQFIKAKNSANRLYSWGLLLCGGTYLVIMSFIRQFTPANMRYMLILAVCLLPLVGFIYQPRKIFLFLTIACVFTGLWTQLNAYHTSFMGGVLGMDRAEKLALCNIPGAQQLIETIEEITPSNGTIGVLDDTGLPISALYGKNYTRKVVMIVPMELHNGLSTTYAVSPQVLADFDTLIIKQKFAVGSIQDGNEFKLIKEIEGYLIFKRR